ncbi:MAG: HAMP domain-containing methyl-accepting chemotaxis protein [Rhodocyclaceae bacterium]
MNTHSIGFRLATFATAAGLLLAAIAAIGLQGEKQAVDALKTVYEDRTTPLVSLFRIAELRGANEKEILLMLQRDPRSPLADAHGQPPAVHFEHFERRSQEINALWDNYMATQLTAEEKRLAADFAAKRKAWIDKMQPLFGRIKAGDYAPEVARALLAGTLGEGRAAKESLDALADYQARQAKAEYAEELRAFRVDLILFTVVLTGALLGGALYAWRLTRGITVPIGQAVVIAEAIADGDLTSPVPQGGHDEAGRLLAAFARMQDGLRVMVGASQRNANELARAAQELTVAARQTATATDAQSEAASGMAAAVEQMSVSIDQVRDHARAARGVAAAAGEASRAGGQVVHSTADEMRQVAAAVNDSAGSIRELENYSKEISDIVNVIREVAEQTNLLALNAAIEAARAGEQGRGFAVVADEVRKLAERTATSTQSIAAVIEKVQVGARRAAQEMDNGVARVGAGVELAHRAGGSITDIQASAGRVAGAVDDIGSALDEQAAAAQEIARGVERIAGMAEENSAGARQTSSAADRLGELAGELERSVARFRA